jgi:hypothetical protein
MQPGLSGATLSALGVRLRPGRFASKPDDITARSGLAVGRPRLHQLAPLLQRVGAPVSLLGLVANDMRQRGRHHFAGKCDSLPALAKPCAIRCGPFAVTE